MSAKLIASVAAAAFLYGAHPVHAAGEAQLANGSAGRLAGKTAKRVVLPVTLVLLAADAQAAYEQNCTQLENDEDIGACTTAHFLDSQVDELEQLAQDARLTWKYVVVPEAQQFWEDNGDDIKEAAATTADTLLDVTASTLVAFDNWLDGL